MLRQRIKVQINHKLNDLFVIYARNSFMSHLTQRARENEEKFLHASVHFSLPVKGGNERKVKVFRNGINSAIVNIHSHLIRNYNNSRPSRSNSK